MNIERRMEYLRRKVYPEAANWIGGAVIVILVLVAFGGTNIITGILSAIVVTYVFVRRVRPALREADILLNSYYERSTKGYNEYRARCLKESHGHPSHA